MTNPDIQSGENEEFFRKKKEQEKKFPRFNALASKKHEVIFDRDLNFLHLQFISDLREKHGAEAVGNIMAYNAGISTPPEGITKWDFEGKDSIERFLYRIVLEKKATEFLRSKFKEQYLLKFFEFSKKLSEQVQAVNQMEALNIAVGSPIKKEFEIFDTPDFQISNFVDQEHEKYFPKTKK